MEILKTVLSSRADYLHALKSAPKMPLPPAPLAPAPVQITPIVQQTMPTIPPTPSSSGGKSYSKTFRNLFFGALIGLIGAYLYQKIDEAKERKRQMK